MASVRRGVFRTFNAGINLCVRKYNYWFGTRRDLRTGRLRIKALGKIAKPESIRPALVQECVRVRTAIIHAMQQRGPEITWQAHGLAAHVIDVTNEVQGPGDHPPAALVNLAKGVNWRHFKDRVGKLKEYATADVDLVTFTLKRFSEQQVIADIDYFYTDLRHGRIEIVLNERHGKYDGMLYLGGSPSLKVQDARVKGKLPTKAYPISLGDTAKHLSELAMYLGIEGVTDCSIYWPVKK